MLFVGSLSALCLCLNLRLIIFIIVLFYVYISVCGYRLFAVGKQCNNETELSCY